jgi:hypothetical protein
MVECWICDQCGHHWIKEGEKLPTRCAKCRRRNWDRPAGSERRAKPDPQRSKPAEPVPAVPKVIEITSEQAKQGPFARYLELGMAKIKRS